MNAELPPIKNREHNFEIATIERVITLLKWKKFLQPNPLVEMLEVLGLPPFNIEIEVT